MNTLLIKNIDISLAQEWDDYLLKNANASFYQLFGWNQINSNHFSHRVFNLAAFENNTIRGVFPLVLINSSLFGKILCSMPFVNFGGPCADSTQIETQLLDAAIKIAKESAVDYLEMRLTHIIDENLPSNQHKISMTLDLASDPEEVWNRFNTKHRTNIRRVYKNNVSVRSGQKELLDDFYYILSNSWRALGTPIYRKKYFSDILDTFPNQSKIFISYLNESTPIAGAFNGYFNGTVEGMWAGGISQYRRLQPNYVLYWEMIKDACESGFKLYHLGRSSVNSTGEQFKKKWKADSKQLYWQYYLHKKTEIPQLNVNNPKFELAIKAWQKLPLNLTTIIGPFLAKNIP